MGVISAILVLSVLVLIHEAGHALVARLAGMRVTELFIGMPYGPSVSMQSPRSGIRYGATLALIGGFTRISGMSYQNDERLAFVLALVNARGRLTVSELAQVLVIDEDEAGILLDTLAELGSIEACSDNGKPAPQGTATTFMTVARDSAGLTVYDRGNHVGDATSSAAGERYDSPLSPEDLLASDVAHSYAGKGYFKRVAVLLAGITVNILTAILIITLYYSLVGAQVFSPSIESVTSGSAAEAAGVQAGDIIVEIDGVDVTGGYAALDAALAGLKPGAETPITFKRGDETLNATVTPSKDGLIGVNYGFERVRLSPAESLSRSLDFALATGEAILQLINPQTTASVSSQSAGVVGIVVLSSEAFQAGLWSLLTFAASISLSLGWLNLLPIPPLDGGKVLIETIQAITRRPVPLRVQSAISLVGMGLVLLLFVVMLGQDIIRLFTGGF